VTFKAGPRLQFLFHSDSSNNEWGYKFTVTAYGLPDVAVSWGLDLQLLVCRLMGRLASRSMALKSQRGECTSQLLSLWCHVVPSLLQLFPSAVIQRIAGGKVEPENWEKEIQSIEQKFQ